MRANNVFKREISVAQPAKAAVPDLYVSEFALNPATPTQGKPVAVHVGVTTKAKLRPAPSRCSGSPVRTTPHPPASGPWRAWWQRRPHPHCNYAGYPSWYAKLNTKVVVDRGAAVAESDEANNVLET